MSWRHYTNISVPTLETYPWNHKDNIKLCSNQGRFGKQHPPAKIVYQLVRNCTGSSEAEGGGVADFPTTGFIVLVFRASNSVALITNI